MGRKSTRVLWSEKVKSIKPIQKSRLESQLPQKQSFNGLVLGIDPSLRSTGLALVMFEKGYPIKIIESTTVVAKIKETFSNSLANIFKSVADVMEKHDTMHVALEQTIYVQNFQTAQILGAARGAAIAAAALKGGEVFEYAPLRIKQAVVGYGRASKVQVAKTIMQLLKQDSMLPSDEADAAGAAICHAMTYGER